MNEFTATANKVDISHSKRSYANIAAAAAQTKVLIKPKDDKQDSDTTKSDVLSKLQDPEKQVTIKTKSKLTHLQYLESKIGAIVLKSFKNSSFTEENKYLYDIWRQFVNVDSQLREFYNYNVQEVKGSASEVAIADVNSSNGAEFLVEQNVMEFDFPEFEHNETWSTITSNTENLIDEELGKQKDQSESALPNDFDTFSLLDSSLFDQTALQPEELQQNAVLLQLSSEPTTYSKEHALCLEEKKDKSHIQHLQLHHHCLQLQNHMQ
ncbi:hypothetical protein RN001_012405 [Aquatica leii]|uniref:Uncharacterized protein n=1 Tax=Aquatica leii TaxID=1421715 RepID=A0AAN7SMF6_9COLE|nr:hypothetical protein RN001_012405 [Aquatica leii]